MTKSTIPGTPANPTALGLDNLRVQNQAMFVDFRNDMNANTAALRADVRRMTATLTQDLSGLGKNLGDVRRSVDGLRARVNKVAAMLLMLVAILALGAVLKKS